MLDLSALDKMNKQEQEYIETCAAFFTAEGKAELFTTYMQKCIILAQLTRVYSWHDLMGKLIQDIRTHGEIKETKWIIA